MIGASSASKLRQAGASWCLVVATLAAILVMGLAGEAAACPPGTKSHHAAVKHKAKFVTVHVAPAPGNSASSPLIGHCCGGPLSSAGSSCKAGCCAAGLPVIDVPPNRLGDTEPPTTYVFRVQGDLSSLEPARHFRPPQAI